MSVPQSGPAADGPAVSVVLPALDREATIAAAIRSVLRQTWDDFELIVVDDGSTDGTVAAARAVADPRLRVIELGRTGGVSAARNAGIAEARAPWVAFQDSDDEWLPEKLERQMARLAEMRGAGDGNGDGGPDWIAAYCGMAILGETPSGRATVGYVPAPHLSGVEGDIHPTLAMTSLVSTQTLVARTDAVRDVGGFDEALRALVDWDLVLRLARRGRIAFVDAPLVLQTFSGNSITRDARRRVEARERLLEKHADAFATVPGALAHHARAVAGGWRRLGEPARGRAALAGGLAAAPLDARLRLAALALALPAALTRRD